MQMSEAKAAKAVEQTEKVPASSERPSCLRGKGVTKIFGFGDTRTVAVDHVDFDFHEGEIISIVGESGSGKTTISKMLLGPDQRHRRRDRFSGKTPRHQKP